MLNEHFYGLSSRLEVPFKLCLVKEKFVKASENSISWETMTDECIFSARNLKPKNKA